MSRTLKGRGHRACCGCNAGDHGAKQLCIGGELRSCLQHSSRMQQGKEHGASTRGRILERDGAIGLRWKEAGESISHR